jgi:hypothetical protein
VGQKAQKDQGVLIFYERKGKSSVENRIFLYTTE